MKKITYILVLFIISITLVNAKNCTIISGTGKNIGDEIACGSEHFYVVSNDGTNVKMLGKYNLLTENTYDSIMIDEYYFTYDNEIYKNKQVRDRINETGILLNTEESNYEWDSEKNKYKITQVNGSGGEYISYKVVIFDDELSTKKEVLEHPSTVELLNKGYKINNYRPSHFLADNSTKKYFGLILEKEEDYENKTIFLDGTIRTLEEMIRTKEVTEILEQGFNIYNSYYDSESNNYYAVTFEKNKTQESKIVFLDGAYKTEEEMMKIPQIKNILDQGYMIYQLYYNNTSNKNNKNYYDYYAIILNKNKDTEYKTIFLDGLSRSIGELIKLEDVKNLLDQGYRLSQKSYFNKVKKNNEYYYTFFAVTLSKNESFKPIYIIFDEKKTQTETSNYIANNTFIQEKLSDGYSYLTHELGAYCEGYYTYGISLYRNNESILQNSKAIGINGDVNGPNYPIYGLIVQDEELSGLRSESYYDGEVYGGEYYQNFDISRYEYLQNYRYTLQEMGYPITKISTLSVEELNEMTKKITGKEIPLKEWYENKTKIGEYEGDAETYHILGNLKDIYTEEFQEKYSWIWGTSYWLRTIDPNYDIYDINTMGDLCLTDVCNSTPSRGVRPLVTISATNIDYKIETKTDGNGKVEATHDSAKSGDEVKFTIEPERGYKLKEIKVTDYEGNVIIFTENTFTMPNSNVLIEATFEIKNPNTISISIIAALMFSILSIIIVKVNYKKMKWLNE